VTPLELPEPAREESILKHEGDVAPSEIHTRVTLEATRLRARVTFRATSVWTMGMTTPTEPSPP